MTGPSLPAVVLAIGAGAWPQPARIARAEIRSLRERDFVASARVAGMHPLVIGFREILPNALPPVISLAAIIAAVVTSLLAVVGGVAAGLQGCFVRLQVEAGGRTIAPHRRRQGLPTHALSARRARSSG